MAGRTLNRRELRKQADQAEQKATAETAESEATAAAAPAKKKGKAKAPATPKVKKPRKKATQRLCVKWGVFDASMKQVALFDYNQRAAADQKVADLAAKKNGIFFLQIVKEPMPEPEPDVVVPG
jgi:hypothetical protein